MKFRIFRIAILLLSIVFAACSQKTEKISRNPVENFDALWQIIDQKYCYLDEKNINWDSIYSAYRPRIEMMTTTDVAFFDVMEQMIAELRDAHVNLYTPFDVSSYGGLYDGFPTLYDATAWRNTIGSDYRYVNGLCYKILPDSATGYIRYSSFQNGFSSLNLAYIFNSFKNCKKIILDVRQNGGGSLELSYRLAAAFFKDKTTIGYRRHKTGTGHSDFSAMEAMQVNPDDASAHWLRPVIVLTDRGCYSATNHFILCMQQAPNATILGGQTGGGGGMPLSYELPNGWMIRFSAVAMYDTAYHSIEDGLLPDIPVNSADFTSGQDPLIQQAQNS